MKMTMQKIAELAGVSRGAVDKTIHNRPGVKPEIRKKILRVIEETGYTPLKDRKQMVSPMRAKTVTVILPRLTNPYFYCVKAEPRNAFRHIAEYPIAILSVQFDGCSRDFRYFRPHPAEYRCLFVSRRKQHCHLSKAE